MSEILQWLSLNPSPQSADYVGNKTQFHLFNLLTEQRHPNTWNVSFAIQSNSEAGRECFCRSIGISRRS